jgi:diguanylate cyclase (GGDEF)-like protein
LDYFKKINDTYGHTVGDYVLMEFANICSREIRKTDMIGRLGGEEFAVMLPNTDVENARILAERIRKAVDQAIFEYQTFRIHLTVSIGLASFPLVDANDLNELIIKADEFLYQAKEKRDLKVNLTGAYNCSKAVWPRMVHKGWGRIINISSVTALMGASLQPSLPMARQRLD